MSVLAPVARRSAGWGKPIGLFLALLVAASAPAALTVQNYYRLGEADPGAVPGVATNTLDSVGGKHLGVSNAPLYSADVSSEAALRLGSARSMNFSAGMSSVSGVLLSGVTDNFALEAWVKPTSVTGPHCIAYNGNTGSSGWGIMQYGNTFQGLFGGVTFVGVGPAVLNTWARVALVRNAGTTTLYVNGVAYGSSTSTPKTPSGSFAIASSPSSLSSEFFQGLVDEVRFFTFAPGEFTTDQGFWAVSAWTNDASSGLAPGVAWAYHFGAVTTGTVNGVSVPGVAGGNPAVSNQFAFSGLPLNVLNDSNALTALGGPGSAVLAHDFVYGGNPGTITLSGLTVGQNYRVSILGVGFDAALARKSTFTGGFDSLTVDENIFGNDQGVRLDYTFTARTTNRVLSITPELAGQTFHVYALTLRALAPEMGLRQPANFPLLTSGAGVWGRNNSGQLITPPLGQFGVRAIAAAEHHVVVLRNDGTVVAWGNNANGQTSVPGGLSGVQAIATSSGHTLVLKDDGSLTAWGSIGETYILPGLTGVVAIASGSGHKMVLKNDGSVVAWGSNLYGQTNVPPGLNGVAAIAAAGLTSMALQSNGLVTAWGNNNGQASVPAGLSNVVAISLGIAHSMALKHDGTVVAWGANNYGQSDGPAGLSNVMAIAAGGSHSLALKSNGTVVAWGANYSTQTDVPLSLAYSAKAIAAGADHSVALFDSVIDFGNQVIATTGTAKTFTITNSGPDPLTLHGLSVVGAAALDFQVNLSGLAATVAASNGVATFTVTFTPGGVGERVAKLRVASNDRDENPYEITLAGVGLAAPEIAVFTGAGTAAANERTDNLGTNVFATTLVGGSSAAQTFTITNLGTTNLTGLALSKSGANSGDFIVSALGATTLVPNAAQTFTVTFSPTANGTRRALVALASNDGDENPFRIHVSGTGLGFPEITVEQPAGTLIADGGSRDFGAVKVDTNRALTFRLQNLGSAELLLTGTPRVAVGGAHAADFTVTVQPVSPVLGSGDAVTLTNAGFETPPRSPGGFAYNPSGTGWTFGSAAGVARNGSPWFVNAAPEGSQAAFIQLDTAGAIVSRPVNFPSTGDYLIRFALVRRDAVNPANDIQVRMDGVTLRTVSNTEQSDDVWRIFSVPYVCTNAGNHTLAFVGTRGALDNASALDAVEILGATTFEVTFAPTASGLRTATLSIANNDSDENPYDITLTGTGTVLAPEIAVFTGAGTAAANERTNHIGTNVFATTALGSNSVAQIFTITNTGTAILNGLAVTNTGAHPGDFILGALGTNTLAPNATTTFTVTFAPTATGPRSAAVAIASNDQDESPFVINVSGTGLALAPEIAVFTGAGTTAANERTNNIGTNLFTATGVGSSSAAQIFTITNTSTAALTGLVVTKMGANPGDFVLGVLGTNLLAPNAATTFTVAFNPQALGVRNATVAIASNDEDENPFQINVAGTGLAAPEISVFTGASTNAVDERVDNGGTNVFAGTVPGTSTAQTFTIKNVGAANLTGLSLNKSGVNTADFILGALGTNNLATNATTTFTVTFAPTAGGVRAAVVTIASNDGDENPFEIRVGGTGLVPEISIELPAGRPLVSGRVVAWGSNSFGQTTVPGGLTGVQSLALGSSHSAALKSNGTVVVWGLNNFGQTNVPPGLTNVRAISAGLVHVTALKWDGTVVAWGYNGFGESATLPGLTGVVAIAAGQNHNVVLKSNGTVVAWGYNVAGQTTVPAGLTNIQAVAAGMDHSVALRSNGTVVAWGRNTFGESSVPAGLTNVQAIAAGGSHTMALRSNGTIVVWGKNNSGETNVPAGLTNVLAMAAGGDHIAVRTDFAVAFGNQAVASASAATTFTIRNTGDDVLNITNVIVTGGDASHFTVDTTGILASVPTNGQTTFTVTFTPGAPGERTTTLRVVNNDRDENPFDIVFTGTGVGAEVGVSGNGVEIADGDSTPGVADHTDFGSVNLPGDTVVRTFTITNAGNASLALGSVTVGGTNANDFIVNVQPAANVAAGGSTTFQITFTPGAAGLRSASLNFTNNDADENPYDIALAGTGVNLTPPPPVIRTPSLTVLGNGAFQLNFVNTNNAIFSVLAATNIALPASNWTVLGTATNLGGGLYQFTDPNATNYPGRFYRLRFP